MTTRAVTAALVLGTLVLAGCASSPVAEDRSVVQFIDIRNDSGEPVIVTARVGAGVEERLGFLEPGASRRFDVPTGAASTNTVELRARNPQTGREARQALELAPDRTLEWSIRL